jgi:hypothetical protein
MGDGNLRDNIAFFHPCLDRGELANEIREKKKLIYRKKRTSFPLKTLEDREKEADMKLLVGDLITQELALEKANELYPCNIAPVKLRDWGRKKMIPQAVKKLGLGRNKGAIGLYTKEYPIYIAITKRLKDIGFTEKEIAIAYQWHVKKERTEELMLAFKSYFGQNIKGNVRLGQAIFWWGMLFSIALQGLRFDGDYRLDLLWGKGEEPEKIRILKLDKGEDILIDKEAYLGK